MVSREVSTVVPWFGTNRMRAEEPGRQLRGCAWVGVGCGGGLTELRHIDARTILVGDLHRHMINLARVMGDPVNGPKLYRAVRRRVVHPDELAQAQAFCKSIEESDAGGLFHRGCSEVRPLDWAVAFFIASWLGRSGCAGTDGEFDASFAARWTAGGGDSATRFRSAAAALVAWRRVFARCTFEVMDVFDFLARCLEGDRKLGTVEPAKRERRGIYLDPPWPGAGDGYRHKFTVEHQRRLARLAASFTHYRVVVRYGDHPLIRELYPRDRWTWIEYESRDQDNKAVPEVLLVNGPAEK